MLACRAISFTAKRLRAARARVGLVHNTVLEKRKERTVLGGLATESTLSNITGVYYVQWRWRDGLRDSRGARCGLERSATDRQALLLLWSREVFAVVTTSNVPFNVRTLVN